MSSHGAQKKSRRNIDVTSDGGDWRPGTVLLALLVAYVGGFAVVAANRGALVVAVWGVGLPVAVGLEWLVLRLYAIVRARNQRFAAAMCWTMAAAVVAMAVIVMCVAVACEDSAGKVQMGQVRYARQAKDVIEVVQGAVRECIPGVVDPPPFVVPPLLPRMEAIPKPGGGDDILILMLRVRPGFIASEWEGLLKASGRTIEDLARDNFAVDIRTWWDGDWIVVDLRRSLVTLPQQPLLERKAEVILEAIRSSLGSVEPNDGAMRVLCGLAPDICAAAYLFAAEYRSHATASGKCAASVETRWIPAVEDGAGNVDLFGRALLACRDWTGAVVYCESRAMEFVFPSDGTTSPPTNLRIWEGRTWLADCEAAG